MPLPLYLLAMAVFAMGTSEFMLAGLLPDIASDLDVTVGTAGTLTSAFAVGMLVGALLVAALGVLPCEVGDAAGGWVACESGVSAVVIVGVQPLGECFASFLL
jgi:MFS family permease